MLETSLTLARPSEWDLALSRRSICVQEMYCAPVSKELARFNQISLLIKKVATTEHVLTIAASELLRSSGSAAALTRDVPITLILSTLFHSSVVATVGLPKRAIYSASKGAILSLTLAMAADLLAEKIRVNCVNPGTAETPWIGRLLSQATDPVKERAALEARQPMGRLVSADEVANAIIYLAHPGQKSTTGTVLAVDGGLHSLNLPK